MMHGRKNIKLDYLFKPINIRFKYVTSRVTPCISLNT